MVAILTRAKLSERACGMANRSLPLNRGTGRRIQVENERELLAPETLP